MIVIIVFIFLEPQSVATTVPISHPNQLQHPSPSTTPQIQHRKLIQSPTPSVQQNAQPPIAQPIANEPPSTSVTAKVSQNQALQDNEQFALAWLRATFEPVPTMATRVEQQDMYKMYLTASSKIGRIGVSSPHHFPRCVRTVFGNNVGPNSPKSDSSTQFYEGIRIRAKPLAVVYKGTILVSVALYHIVIKPTHIILIYIVQQQGQVEMVHKKVEKPQPQHILQKVLSNQTGEALMVTTPAPTASSSDVGSVSNVSSIASVPIANNQPPTTSNATAMQPPQPQLVTVPPTSSSMIKSLLANKVMNSTTGTPETNQVAATNQLHHQFDAGSASKLIKANVNVHQVTPVCDVL